MYRCKDLLNLSAFEIDGFPMTSVGSWPVMKRIKGMGLGETMPWCIQKSNGLQQPAENILFFELISCQEYFYVNDKIEDGLQRGLDGKTVRPDSWH